MNSFYSGLAKFKKNSEAASAALAAKPTIVAAVPDAGGPQGTAAPTRDMMNWIAPAAQQRWLGAGIAVYTPQFVEMIFRQAYSGDLQSEWELFDMMKATSPRLSKNMNQVTEAVIAAGIKVNPFKLKDAEATPEAIDRADLVDEALRTMRPRADRNENDLDRTMRDLLDAKWNAHSILETSWEMRARAAGGDMAAPRCTRWVHPAWYGYPKGPGDEQIFLKVNPFGSGVDTVDLSYGNYNPGNYAEFPPNKFIIAVSKNRTGHPLGSAMLHSMATLWAMANFNLEWLMNLGQIFGQPIRWANYDPNMTPGDQQKLISMLQNMGSAAWGAFPAGTQLQIIESLKNAGVTPQKVMIDYWDTMCDIVILGQTLTTDMAPSGGARAGGEVHERVLDEVELSYSRWLCGVLQQLVNAIIEMNYDGDVTQCPTLSPPVEEEDESGEIIGNLKLLSDAGFEPADEELPRLSERIGFKIQRKAEPSPNGGGDADDKPLTAKDKGGTGDELEEIAAKEAPAVAAALRENFGPVIKIIRDSKSPAEARQRIRAHFAEWRPGQLVAAMEPALQKCAALGAAEASTQSHKEAEAQSE